MAQYKTCNICNLNKELEEFSKRKVSKDGFRNSCKLCIKNQKSNYYFNNIDNLKKLNKKWRTENKENLKIIDEKFYLKNPNYKKDYYIENRNHINDRNKKRRENDSSFRLKENIRHLIRNSIINKGYKKNTKTIDILGINNEDFKIYLESKFEPWMTWDNYGNPKDGILEPNKSWDIDHRIPLCTVVTEHDVISLNHYTNLQPLCSYINRVEKRNNDNKLKLI